MKRVLRVLFGVVKMRKREIKENVIEVEVIGFGNRGFGIIEESRR